MVLQILLWCVCSDGDVIVKIAVLADLHLGDSPIPVRRSDVADILLLRAVHRHNRLINPDVTLVLGDLIDDGGSVDALDKLQRLKKIIDLLKSPSIVVPGNHDGDVEAFYSVFDRPADIVDIKGVRFLPFVDPERPGCNAERTQADLDRMVAARAGFDGAIVSVQHVPLFPPGQGASPYNYTNADKIIETMHRVGISLAVSGHFHPGMSPVRTETACFVATPALCETPFGFIEIAIDKNNVKVANHQLQMPEKLRLVDHHVHTQYAYCNENMDIVKTVDLARDFGLADVGFAEHSSHLYFTRPAISQLKHLTEGLACQEGRQNRADDYFRDLKAADCSVGRIGLEVDCGFDGSPVVRDQDRQRTGCRIGAVHSLPEMLKAQPDTNKLRDEFLAIHRRFLTSGIDILAHPFRMFRRAGMTTPSELFEPLVRMLAKNEVAAEINFHTNEPPEEFFSLCIESGVQLTLGSDSHNLYEIGEFSLHLDFLQRCGVADGIDEILADPGLSA